MTRRGERGSALLAAVGMLGVMSLLAAMSLMAGGADLVISTRLARERSAFYAAESALETTMEEIASGGPVPEASLHAPWPAPAVAVRHWQDGEWACSRRICLIPDIGDVDGDPATTAVLFDRSFGHASSPLSRGGYPVVQVLVAVRGNESRQAVVAEIAAVTCAPIVTAAWTAAGPLDLAGDIGVLGASDIAAVAGSSLVRLREGAVIEGGQLLDPQVVPYTGVLPIMNAGGTLSQLEELPEPRPGGTLDGQFWSRGDYTGPLAGTGILVVHNPSFDPVKHEASRIAIEVGIPGEGYDPAYSHLDPARRPARLEFPSGGAFAGVIIADVVGNATAPFTLTGALFTLTRSPLTVAASLPLRIIGSRTAIERSGRGALRHLIGFRPLATAAAWPDQCP